MVTEFLDEFWLSQLQSLRWSLDLISQCIHGKLLQQIPPWPRAAMMNAGTLSSSHLKGQS